MIGELRCQTFLKPESSESLSSGFFVNKFEAILYNSNNIVKFEKYIIRFRQSQIWREKV